MIRKSWLGLALALGMTFCAAAEDEDIVVRVAPPHVRVEHRPPRPGPEYVWQPGYYRYDGNRHIWVDGRWEMPPHHGAHWVAHHWVKRNGGWVLVEGHWN